jgi:serine/threonine protein kinase
MSTKFNHLPKHTQLLNYREDPAYIATQPTRALISNRDIEIPTRPNANPDHLPTFGLRQTHIHQTPEFDSPSKRYIEKSKLGEGAYGEVWLVYDRKTQQNIALKKVKNISSSEGIPQTTLREVSILRDLDHENIVRLHDIHFEFDKKSLSLTFEYIELDLAKYLKNLDGRGLSLGLTQIKQIMFKMINAINYLHERAILHRDLKPCNILVDKSGGQLKIADFGLSRGFQLPFRPLSNEIVTLWYRAPEILLGETNYGIGVDIWSIGCIMAELFTKMPLFCGDCDIGQLYKIFQVIGSPTQHEVAGYEKMPEFKKTLPRFRGTGLENHLKGHGIDSDAIDLMKRFLRLDPVERCTLKEALEHPFFESITS